MELGKDWFIWFCVSFFLFREGSLLVDTRGLGGMFLYCLDF